MEVNKSIFRRQANFLEKVVNICCNLRNGKEFTGNLTLKNKYDTINKK